MTFSRFKVVFINPCYNLHTLNLITLKRPLRVTQFIANDTVVNTAYTTPTSGILYYGQFVPFPRYCHLFIN